MLEKFNHNSLDHFDLPPLFNIAKTKYIRQILDKLNQGQKKQITYNDFLLNYKLSSPDEEKRAIYLNIIFCSAILELQQLDNDKEFAEFDDKVVKIKEYYEKNKSSFDQEFHRYYQMTFQRIDKFLLDRDDFFEDEEIDED